MPPELLTSMTRITSYNVCYTKLLRCSLAPAMSTAARITSYNVCYTKLLREIVTGHILRRGAGDGRHRRSVVLPRDGDGGGVGRLVGAVKHVVVDADDHTFTDRQVVELVRVDRERAARQTQRAARDADDVAVAVHRAGAVVGNAQNIAAVDIAGAREQIEIVV